MMNETTSINSYGIDEEIVILPPKLDSSDMVEMEIKEREYRRACIAKRNELRRVRQTVDEIEAKREF